MAKSFKRWNKEGVAKPKSTDIILSMYSKGLGSSTTGQQTNYYLWYNQWRDTKIGIYGAEYRVQFDNGASPAFNLEAQLEEYPIVAERPFSKDYWVPTAEQHTELMSIANADERAYQRDIRFNVWSRVQREANAISRDSNEINKIKREELIKMESTCKDTVAHVFSDILASMDKLSQEKVLNYIEVREGEDYGIDLARNRYDWMFLFLAARNTHIILLA
jgi:hypothetical protein